MPEKLESTEIFSQQQQTVLETLQKKLNETAAKCESDHSLENTLELLSAKAAWERGSSLFDETGAFIGDHFHSEIYEYFKKPENAIEIDEQTGLIIPKESYKNKYFVYSTAATMAQVNNAEGHHGGDQRLRDITTMAEHAIRVEQNEQNRVFHTFGASFALSVETTPDLTIEQIENRFREKNLAQDVIANTNIVPEATFAAISVEDAITQFNYLQTLKLELAPDTLTTSNEIAQKETMSLLLGGLTYLQEHEKAQIICEKVTNGTANLEEYFELYARPFFELENPTITLNEITKMTTTEQQTLVASVAEKYARSYLEGEPMQNGVSSEVLDDFIKEKLGDYFIKASNISVEGQPQISDKLKELKSKSFNELQAYAQTKLKQQTEQPIFENTLSEKEDPAESKTTQPRNSYEKEMYERNARMSTITSKLPEIEKSDIEFLFEVGNIPQELREQLIGKIQTDEQAIKALFEIAEDYQEVYNTRHDSLTGLPKRFMFFQESNELLAEARKNGEHHGVIFVDLGFLSYFNKEGNRETGNEAIQLAAEKIEDQLENSLGENWKEYVRLYRYGGDEFTLVYSKGGPSVEYKLIQLAYNIHKEGTTVETKGTVKDSYEEEALQINLGVCNASLGARALQRLYERKIFTGTEGTALEKYLNEEDLEEHEKDFINELVAKTMATVADKVQIHQKTHEKVMYIASKIRKLQEIKGQPGYEKAEKHLRTLVNNYSGKSTLGQKYEFFMEVYEESETGVEDAWDVFKRKIQDKLEVKDVSERIILEQTFLGHGNDMENIVLASFVADIQEEVNKKN